MKQKIQKFLSQIYWLFFKKPKPRLLLVCAGNTCRSPMAAGIAELMYGDRYQIESAGASANRGEHATEAAIKIMAEDGIDLSKHRARHLADLQLSDFDLIVVFAERIRQSLQDKGVVDNVRLIEISDPYGSDLKTYRRTAAEIKAKLPRVMPVQKVFAN